MVNEPQNVGVKEVERFRSNTWSGTTYGLIWSVQLDETGGVVTVSYIAVGLLDDVNYFRFVLFGWPPLRVDTIG
jgi:hypothetical protein